MIFRFLKYLLFTIIGLFVLINAAYFSFLGIEYLTGSDFVEYLNNNQETVKIGESFSFKTLDNDIAENDLILVGEIHGFEEPQKFDYSLFTHLHKNFEVRYYLAELDVCQAFVLNQFLQNGQDSLLQKALKKWVVVQGVNNIDYYDKYRSLQQFNLAQNSENKFQFVGIDKIQDWGLVYELLNNISNKNETLPELKFSKETYLGDLLTRIEILKKDTAITNEVTLLNDLYRNLNYVKNKMARDEVMAENLAVFSSKHIVKGEKLYGFFGLFHVLQYRVNGKHPFASFVRQSYSKTQKKILSINFLFVDSYNVMPSKMLPEFLRTGPTNTRMIISTDNVWFMYIWGIQDFKRTTPEYSKSLIKMNNEPNNPYGNTNRLNTVFQILPVTDVFEMNDEGEQYVQYSVFVRNSDWAEPKNK